MASDSIANASSFLPISNQKDFAKKKRANRSAKLKQCKLDARREQWLSQVKTKGCKEEANGKGGTVDVKGERGRSIVKLEVKPRVEEENEGFINNYNSDTESLAHSPTSHSSSGLGSNDSGTSFTGSSSHSSSSSSSGRGLGSMSGEEEEEEEEEGDDECLEDWEAFADALAATEEKQEPENDISDLPQESNENASRVDVLQQKHESEVNAQRASVLNCRAWRPDDASRPQGLPNLAKHFGLGDKSWNCDTESDVTSCPICTEEFDVTDTSFCPCLCGYRLCLFCYKRILEYNEARCPGCRRQYDCKPVNDEATFDGGSLTIQLARSSSMVTRS
ncbi:hypothetical protein Leryth_017649 [Lithospermum erythrorhizon]|nr:hypothetical protein Leryth_017649 [Lithospermum erythrorhizon]